jgi:hypothetical protein
MHPDKEDDLQLQACSPNAGIAPRAISGLKWAVVVVSVVASTFLYALDNTVMANIRPGIIVTFGHMEMLPWLSVSYPMGEVGSNPLW